MTIETYLLFLSASFLLWITPGQDTIYIIARSISQGRLSGIISALGIGTGALFHAFLATIGVSLIILTSPILFFTMKLIGGLYLIYLGVSALLSKTEKDKNPNLKKDTLRKIYFQGILTNIFNPKVALFFIAFLPQFINSTSHVSSVILLGLSFVIGGTLWCILVAVFAAKFSIKLKEKNIFKHYLGKITGIVYIYLGLNILKAKI